MKTISIILVILCCLLLISCTPDKIEGTPADNPQKVPLTEETSSANEPTSDTEAQSTEKSDTVRLPKDEF